MMARVEQAADGSYRVITIRTVVLRAATREEADAAAKVYDALERKRAAERAKKAAERKRRRSGGVSPQPR
jgi:hypothetical protein